MLGLYSMLECNLCCEILLLLDMADMDWFLCERLWREHDRVLCSFSECGWGNVYFLEGFVVCIVVKMAQDVGMVESIVVSSPSCLVGF